MAIIDGVWEITRTFQEVSAGLVRLAVQKRFTEEAIEMYERLTEAVLSGDYQAFADNEMQNYWDAVQEGVAPATECQAYFAALIEKCPALKEPLRIAYHKMNPFQVLPDESPGRTEGT